MTFGYQLPVSATLPQRNAFLIPCKYEIGRNSATVLEVME